MNSFEKVGSILKILSEEPYEHGVTEIAGRLNCGKSAVSKIMATLEADGLVEQRDNRKYSLGYVTYLLGKVYEEKTTDWIFYRPYLQRLRDAVEENAVFSAFVNGQIVTIMREDSRQTIRLYGSVGDSRPINATVAGKTIAAHLPRDIIHKMILREPLARFTPNTITGEAELMEEYARIRALGYTISDEEHHIASYGVGAPIFNKDGGILGAIAISMPKQRATKEKIEQCIQLVMKTAQEITKQIEKELYVK